MKRKTFALIDDELVEDTLILRRTLGSPVLKRDKPIIKQAQAFGGVLVDNTGLWRMWYMMPVARDPKKDVVGSECLQCFATSRNGLDWEFPSLGLIEEQGSKKNNIIMGSRQRDANGRYLTGYGGPAGWCVIDAQTTPHPAARGRFTLMYLASPTDAYGGICMAFSDDGINWLAYPENPVIPGSQDTQNCFFWDKRLSKYVCYQRPTIYARPEWHANRKIARLESDDLVHWGLSRVVLDTDERDSPAFEVFDEPGMNHQPRGRVKQFQGISPFPYNDTYLAHTWFYDNGTGGGVFTNELVHSYDGIHWQREALREPFMGDNQPAGFLGKLAVPIASPPNLASDELYFYISNSPHSHHAVAESDADASYANRKALLEESSLYVLSIKRDRWVSYDAGDFEGELLTRPFAWQGGGALYINAQVEAGGYVTVQIEDPWGRMIKEMHLDEIPPINGPIDAVDHHVTFGPGPKTIVKLPPGDTVRLRFRMKKAKLFGWSIAGVGFVV